MSSSAPNPKKACFTNQDFDWTGAHTVKVYKVNTADMSDYDRAGANVGVTDGKPVRSFGPDMAQFRDWTPQRKSSP